MTGRESEKITRKPVKPGKIELEAISLATIINEDERDEIISSNSDTVKSMEIMSPHEGMVITVEDGGTLEEEQDR